MRRSPRPEPGPEINGRLLKYRELRVVDSEGVQVGILPTRQALSMAQEVGFDLVLISATAQPPVAKIIDFGKHKYLEGKLGRDKKSKQQEIKGIKISPRIAEHDIQVAIRKARTFLTEGDKVRVVCVFKAREVTHPELGRKKLEVISNDLLEIANVERTPTLDGKMMVMILLPKQAGGAKKNVKAQDKQDNGQTVQDNRDGQDNPPDVTQQPPVSAQEQ